MRSYYELPAEAQTELNLGLIKGQNLNQVLSLNLPSSFVVRRDIIPESGQLVLVKTQGKFVLRTYVFPGSHEDQPRDTDFSAGRKYVTYLPNGAPEFELFGVVTAIFRKLGRAAPCPEAPVPGSLTIPHGNS